MNIELLWQHFELTFDITSILDINIRVSMMWMMASVSSVERVERSGLCQGDAAGPLLECEHGRRPGGVLPANI
jgi:hypothetical protein